MSLKRIDMYATERGPVFGEFTPTPEGGEGFTEWADRYLAYLLEGCVEVCGKLNILMFRPNDMVI